MSIEPLTIALIVCPCSDPPKLLRVEEWRGKDAHPDEDWCFSHGMCSSCFEALEAACEAAERMAS